MTRTDTRPTHPTRPLALVGLVLAVAAVAVLGSLANAGNVDGWYADAEKPPFNPPNWIFAPVWTTLYILMAVAAWMVLRAGGDLVAWWVQLVLNLAWTPVFFELQWTWGALAVIIALDVAVIVTIVRFRAWSRAAATLLVPYLAWVLFATALNLAIAVLN
jgi:translocator protein